MPTIALWFYDNQNPELAQLVIQTTKRTVVAERGKGYHGGASFQWTAAVKALTRLLIESKIESFKGQRKYLLSGVKGSDAASLDFALGKPPAWLTELFIKTGLVRRSPREFFKITNPELKRPGPVTLSFRDSFDAKRDIRIFLGEDELVHQQMLTVLRDKLDSGSRKKDPDRRKGTETRGALQQLWITSAHSSLKQTTLFQPDGIASLQTRFGRNNRFSKNRTFQQIVAQLRRSLYARPLILQGKKELSIPAFTCACSPMAIGALSILQKLKKRSPVQLDTSFSATSNIMEMGALENYDAVALSWSAVLRLNTKQLKQLVPFMLLPKTEFLLLAPKKQNLSIVLCAPQPLGYPRLLWEELSQQYPLLFSGVRLADASLQATGDTLALQPEAGCIVAFPYTEFLRKRFNLTPQPEQLYQPLIGDNILLIRKGSRFSKPALRKKLQEQIIRSWLELLDKPKELNKVVDTLLSDENYMSFIRHAGGLY